MGFWKKAGKFLFGDNEDRKKAGKDMKNSLGALDKMTEGLMEVDTSNPYKTATNAFAGK